MPAYLMPDRPPPAIPSNRQVAIRNKTGHSFTAGIGYVQHGEPPLPLPGKHPDNRCSPSAIVKDGSSHFLRVPGGSREMPFQWVAAEKAWERPGGRRMAFTAAYLSKAGWVYSRPVG